MFIQANWSPYGYTAAAGYVDSDGECDGFEEGCQRCAERQNTDGSCDDGIGQFYGPYESEDEALAAAYNDCGNCDDHGRLALAATRIESGAIAELAQMIISSEGAIAINAERGAIQARGCGDGIALHVPIGVEFLNALQAELANLTHK